MLYNQPWAKIQNGDVFKILPIIDRSNKLVPFIMSRCIFIDKSKRTLYDTEDKIIRKIPNKAGYRVTQRYFLSILHNGEIKIISVGRSLYKIISDNPSSVGILDNTQLHIIEETHCGFPGYEKSFFCEQDWMRPFDYSEKDKWINWLKSGQKEIHGLLDRMDIKNYLNEVKDEIGGDIIGEIISDLRSEKIESLL